jgi:UTP-glucose-1-phosphate uridylyltransferase
MAGFAPAFSPDQGDAEGNAADCGQTRHPVCVEELSGGITDIIIVTGWPLAIEDHFDYPGNLLISLNSRKVRPSMKRRTAELANFIYIRQRSVRQRHAGTVCQIGDRDEPFVAIWGDEFLQQAAAYAPVH